MSRAESICESPELFLKFLNHYLFFSIIFVRFSKEPNDPKMLRLEAGLYVLKLIF